VAYKAMQRIKVERLRIKVVGMAYRNFFSGGVSWEAYLHMQEEVVRGYMGFLGNRVMEAQHLMDRWCNQGILISKAGKVWVAGQEWMRGIDLNYFLNHSKAEGSLGFQPSAAYGEGDDHTVMGDHPSFVKKSVGMGKPGDGAITVPESCRAGIAGESGAGVAGHPDPVNRVGDGVMGDHPSFLTLFKIYPISVSQSVAVAAAAVALLGFLLSPHVHNHLPICDSTFQDCRTP
jgi:hypothetical protein